MESKQESLQKFRVSHEKEWHRTQSSVLDTLVHAPKVSRIFLIKRVAKLAGVSLSFSTIVIGALLDSKELRIIDESYISIRH